MVIDAQSSLEGSPATAIAIAGRVFEAGTPGFAEAVAEAYAARRRPRCQCRPAGVEMYVARLNDGYVIKRMPQTGNQHAPECLSFELSPGLSGLAQLLDTAIVENRATGDTTLRLDFPLSKGSARSAYERSSSAPGSVSAGVHRLSLRGLLHYLWDQAELTHWQPSFDGKRSWGTVRRHLLRAAEHKIARGSPISARLYVPEVFALDQLESINARRRASWSPAKQQPGRPQNLMLIIAEVKSLVQSHRGYKAVLKHVPDVAFALDELLYRRIERSFGQDLDLWSASEHVHLVMAATFGLATAGTPEIASLCLMPVTRQWLPVETMFEQQLVERLVRDGRAFQKILRYDLPRNERIACVALTDQGEPIPLLNSDGEYVPGDLHAP